ncbi:MAG: hypothetical protein LBL86_02010 [Coriobacteriales bacterium]|jgi:16S rRNA processing protein RimM|nr:hypothetical protein [Coriobacteriales bacterium]
MPGYRRIAHISRAKGLAGQVVADPLDGLPSHVWAGLMLWVVPPAHGLVRETCVRAAVEKGEKGGHLLLSLEGVDGRDDAERLVGRFLLARTADVGEEGAAPGPPPAPGSPPVDGPSSAVGLTVSDAARGVLGTVVEERQGAAQALWVVDGPFGELLVPVVDEFVRGREGDVVRVVLPQGLLELNR